MMEETLKDFREKICYNITPNSVSENPTIVNNYVTFKLYEERYNESIKFIKQVLNDRRNVITYKFDLFYDGKIYNKANNLESFIINNSDNIVARYCEVYDDQSYEYKYLNLGVILSSFDNLNILYKLDNYDENIETELVVLKRNNDLVRKR